MDTEGKEYLGLGPERPKLRSEWLAVVFCGQERYPEFTGGETILISGQSGRFQVLQV